MQKLKHLHHRVLKHKTILYPSLAGGLILFFWGLLSWVAFPWQSHIVHKFQDEMDVYDAIKDNITEGGMYILPNMYKYDMGLNQGQIDKEMSSQGKMMRDGPVMFAAITKGGVSGNATVGSFLIYLLTQICGAGIGTWILSKTKIASFKHKVAFIALFGFSAGLLGIFPLWAWWGFSGSYVISCWAQLIVGWAFAGMGIAKVQRVMSDKS